MLERTLTPASLDDSRAHQSADGPRALPCSAVHRVLAATCVLLAACLSSPDPANVAFDARPLSDARPDADAGCVDVDEDGYLPAGCGGVADDCMEGVAAVHPGALDVVDNEVDEDCLGGDLTAADALVPNTISGDVVGTTVVNGVLSVSFLRSFGQAIADLRPTDSDSNLLYTGPAYERAVGTHWGLEYFDRDATAPAVTGVVSNRAVYRRRVAWSAVATDQLTGVRWETVHPDGRIHLDHAVHIEPMDAGYLTSSVSLVPGEFTHVSWSAGADGEKDLAAYDYGTDGDSIQLVTTNNGAPAHACAYNYANQLLLGWGWSVTVPSAASGARISQNMVEGLAANYNVALELDWRTWVDGEVTTALDFEGNFLLYLGAVDTDPCFPMELRHDEVTRPARLVAATGSLVTDSAGDDDGDGYDDGGGFYSLQAAAGDVEVTVDAQSATLTPPQSSTFFIAGVGERDPVVYLDDAQLGHGSDYHLAHEADGVWLHLGRALAEGSVLRVDSP